MKKSILASIGLSLLMVIGCAPAKFYSNSGLTQNTGLKYYTSKPYLQVEKDPINNIVVKATVIYLPDLANPEFLVVRGGIGSKTVNIKLKDGTLDTFNLSSDTKIPELLEAFAKLVPAGINAITDLKAPSSVPKVVASPNIIELYEISMGPEGTTLKKVEFK